MSALPSEKSQEKGEIISVETVSYARVHTMAGWKQAFLVITCDALSDHNSNITKPKYLNNYTFLKEAFQNTGIMQHSTLYTMGFICPILILFSNYIIYKYFLNVTIQT